MHYYIISGELSGDLYGSRLIKSLKNLDSNAHFTCWGGDYMKKEVGQLVRNLDQLSFIGFFEVASNLITIVKNFFFAKKHIKISNPDAIILIDYPGFNLRIAKYAKKLNIPVFWFVAPQLWAWKKNRIHILRKCVDKLFVILPFELTYFSTRNIPTLYFGHPLLDIVKLDSSTETVLGKPIIALMPGSRKQEVENLLPTMLLATKKFPDYRFVIICSQSVKRSIYEDFVKDYHIELKFDKHILPSCIAALVASGTATLELAILKIPQVVCYRLNNITYLIAKLLTHLRYISLVNILAKKKVVSELIQHNFNVKNINHELSLVLKTENRQIMLDEYSQICNNLGSRGSFQKIAEVVYSDLSGLINKAANK